MSTWLHPNGQTEYSVIILSHLPVFWVRNQTGILGRGGLKQPMEPTLILKYKDICKIQIYVFPGELDEFQHRMSSPQQAWSEGGRAGLFPWWVPQLALPAGPLQTLSVRPWLGNLVSVCSPVMLRIAHNPYTPSLAIPL